MKKWMLVLSVVVVLMMAFSGAYADGLSSIELEKVEKNVERGNELINKEILIAQRKADQLFTTYYESNYEKFEKEVQMITDKLLEKTNAISSKYRDKAQEFGIEVVCDWVEVELAGKIILVDPLRIVGF